MKKTIFFLIASLSFLLFFLVVLLNVINRSPAGIAGRPTPIPTPTTILAPVTGIPFVTIIPQSTNNLPTYAPERGRGVDPDAPIVKASTGEIQKLSNLLPFNKDYSLSTGLTVSVVIPPASFQNNPWTLTVQIFGIDYQIPQSDADYTRMKASFREAANNVFTWMKKQGVDAQKIIVNWGDKTFIQDRAEEWLASG